jgi:hypothetical protein
MSIPNGLSKASKRLCPGQPSSASAADGVNGALNFPDSVFWLARKWTAGRADHCFQFLLSRRHDRGEVEPVADLADPDLRTKRNAGTPAEFLRQDQLSLGSHRDRCDHGVRLSYAVSASMASVAQWRSPVPAYGEAAQER